MTERPLAHQLLRFLLVGGANTLLTYLLLLSLLQFLDPRVAYTAAFVVGIVANSLLTGPLVFRSRPAGHRRLLYAAWLVVVYLVGLAMVQVALLADISQEPLLAALPLLVTAPLSFFGGRLLLAESTSSLARGRLSR